MANSKLILLEGIPGSGKSSAGAYIQSFLELQGVIAHFWREGDLDHPADFEGVACLSTPHYGDILARHPQLTALLQQHVTLRGVDCLVAYRKLQHNHPLAMPQALVDELAQHDVYDGLPMAEYCRLALDRWRDFCQDAKRSDMVTMLECCLLQNPLTVLLARHDADPLAACEHIARIAAVIEPLDPLVIYLSPQDARAALEQVRAERPAEWADFVTWYLTGQAYGQTHPVAGWEGVLEFYEMRQGLEVELLRELPVQSLVLEHTGREWDRCNAEIVLFVGAHLPV